MASIQSLKSYKFEDNVLVAKSIYKNLYELKVDSHNKFIRVFYSESSNEIICWEMLEKKSNIIPRNILRNLIKKSKN